MNEIIKPENIDFDIGINEVASEVYQADNWKGVSEWLAQQATEAGTERVGRLKGVRRVIIRIPNVPQEASVAAGLCLLRMRYAQYVKDSRKRLLVWRN